MVASVFRLEGAGSWMDTFHTLARSPMYPAREESGDRLPLRRVRGRALHSFDVQRGASLPPGKIVGVYYGPTLERGRCNVSLRGFGLCKQMVAVSV